MFFGGDRRGFGREMRRAPTRNTLIATITLLSTSGHAKLVLGVTTIFVLIVQRTIFIIVKQIKDEILPSVNRMGMMWCVIRGALTMERSGRGVVRCYNSTLNVIQALAIAGGVGH